MKIAVTASGPTPDSPVDARFGRAAYFIVMDSETGAFEAVANTQNLQAAQGAGIQAAATVAQSGAEAVITGHCGPKAFRGLTQAGIAVYAGAEGTVREAVERLGRNELQPLTSANVEGHWI